MNLKASPQLPFFLIVIGLYLIIVSPALLSDGMFLDGLFYATIAHNLSNGLGTFWNPHFTATWDPVFHGHPPLAFGIQSLFFTVFGESRFVDKLYSITTFVAVGFIITKIWNLLKLKHAWVPLLFWLLTPLVLWACSNNMLENTLSVFTTLSVLFYLKSENRRKYLYIFLAGLMLALGFLTKGFVAFFPLTVPFLLWALLRQNSFLKMAVDSIVLLLSALIPLLLLIITVPEAKTSLFEYLDLQVFHSVKNLTTVDSRFFIVKSMFSQLITSYVLSAILIIWAWRKKSAISILKSNYKNALFFVLLGLAGVLPIMISMKQSEFYTLATYPFFAIGFGVLVSPLVDLFVNKIDFQSKGFTIFKWIAFTFFATGIALGLFFSNRIGREEVQLGDAYQVMSVVPQGSIININPNIFNDYCLHGYYGRYKNISLDADANNKREFLLILKKDYSDSLSQTYQIVDLKTIDYMLLKRKQ